MDIETRLKNYRENKARLAVIYSRIDEIQGEPYEEYIEGETLRPVDLERTRVSGGTPISSTERVALSKGLSKEAAQELDKLRREAWQLACEVERVEAAVGGLYERERFVIDRFYIDGLTWNELSRLYKQEFDVWMSVSRLKEYRTNATKKLLRILA